MNKLVYFIEHHEIVFISLLALFGLLIWLVFNPKKKMSKERTRGEDDYDLVGDGATSEHLLDRIERSRFTGSTGDTYDGGWRK